MDKKYHPVRTPRVKMKRCITAACMILALVTVCLSVSAAVSIDQHKSNVFTSLSEPESLMIILNKYEKDADGIITTHPVTGAEFDLYSEDETYIGGPYYTDEHGQIFLAIRLNAGRYYFLETNPSIGYDYDIEDGERVKRYYFEIQGGDDEIAVVTAYNRAGAGDLTIEKIVENKNGAPITQVQSDLAFGFVIIFSNDGSYECIIDEKIFEVSSGETIFLKHGQKAVFLNLPLNLEYTVEEIVVPGYEIVSENSSGIIGLDKNEVVFTNIYSLEVILEKFEKTEDGDITSLPVPDAVFYLYNDDDELIGGPYTTDREGRIELSRTPLDPGNYYFLETQVPDGYIYDEVDGETLTRYEFAVGGEAGEKIIVTAYNRRMSGGLEITKTVRNQDGSPLTDEQADQKFEFVVTFSDGGTYTYIAEGQEKTVASGGSIYLKHGQKAVFHTLPVGISYKVIETPLEDYLVRSENHQGTIREEISRVTYINIAYEEEEVDEESELIIKKIVEGSPPDQDTLFYFILTMDGEKHHFTLKAGEEIRFTAAYGAWYEVFEEDTEGYIKKQITNGYGTASETVIVIEQTNEYKEPEAEEIELSGEKKWDLGGHDVILPESITIYIKAGEKTAAIVQVSARDNWCWSVNLPKYEEDGITEIIYTVEEEPVEGFSDTVNGWDITNTFIPMESAELFIPIQKEVKGSDKSDEDFEFILEALTEHAPMPRDSDGKYASVVIRGSGKARFGPMLYSETGVYRYLVSEKAGDHVFYTYDQGMYLITVTVTEKTGRLVAEISTERAIDGRKESWSSDTLRFTNIYEEPEIVLSGEKKWELNGYEIEIPDAVSIHIKNGDEIIRTIEVTAENDWIWSASLPEYDADGSRLTYTIEEVPVENFTAAVKGYDITNTYNPPTDLPESPGETKTKPPAETSNEEEAPRENTKKPRTGDPASEVSYVLLFLSGVFLAGIMGSSYRKGRKLEKDKQ